MWEGELRNSLRKLLRSGPCRGAETGAHAGNGRNCKLGALTLASNCSGAVYVNEQIAEQSAAHLRSLGLVRFSCQCDAGHWHIRKAAR